MAVRIDGNNDLINAADGSLTIEGISVNVVGVSTATGGYKVGSAYTVFPNGNVATAGVITATSLVTQQKIVHAEDEDTFMSFPTADTIRFETGGAARLILSSGNILQQSGTLIVKNATSDSNGIKISQESGDESRIFNHFSGPLTFGTANSEKMRITSGGQVGIASAIPTSGFTLDVGGDLTIGEPKGTGNTFIDQKEDGDLHLINSGRTANGASGSPGTAGVGINRFNTRAGGTSLFRDFCVYNGKDTKVLVVDGSASAVGIGTDAPDGALTISKASSTDMLMFNVPGSVGTFGKLGHNSSSGTSTFDMRSEGHIRFLSGGNNERLRIQSDGTTIDQFISQNGGININVTSGSDCAAQIRGKADRSATGNTLLSLHGDWNGTAVTMMDFQAGDDTTNKDDGTIDFYTRPSGGSLTHRLRIDHNGDVIMGNTGAFNSNSSINPCFSIGSSATSRPGIVIRGSTTNKGDISFCDNSGSDSSDGVSEGLLRYDHSDDSMQFHTADSERVRLHSTGELSVPSGITLGLQVDDKTASNTLDDYEEGTFTPTATFETSDDGNKVYSSQAGTYTKVGRMVNCNIILAFSNRGTGSGRLRFNGLPFTVGDTLSNTILEASATVGYFAGLISSVSGIHPAAVSGTDQIVFYAITGQYGASTSDFGYSHVGNAFSIRMSITYNV